MRSRHATTHVCADQKIAFISMLLQQFIDIQCKTEIAIDLNCIDSHGQAFSVGQLYADVDLHTLSRASHRQDL